MRFIGFYDYTVILTYISLVSSVLGMTRAIHADYKTAILCLALSGICDAFDGRVARTKKNRSEDEKAFGIQLDSLCDVICFGVFPAMICYLMGVRGLLGIALVLFYCLCAVIRLGFFNVLEAKRQTTEAGANKTYRGLPVTSIAFVLPLAFWMQFILPEFAFQILLHGVLLVVGFLFILDFPLRKPSLKTIIGLSLLLMLTVSVIIAYTRFRVPAPTVESNPIIEEIEDMFEESEDAEVS
jgi:CDP-diacylglycerol--serine O-phosphatidyltransferase